MTINLGIIGMGYAGFQHLAAARAVGGMRVTAVADPAGVDGARVGEGVAIHQDWKQMLAGRRFDAVSICAPHNLHAEMVELALRSGSQVLLEKPLAAKIEDARRIVELTRKSDRVVMVEMTHRFYPPMREARELMKSGRLGQVIAVEDRIIEPNASKLARWLTQRAAAGGGVALTNGIHMLDRIAWLTGQTVAFCAGAAGWTQQLGDIEDTASMQLALGDGTPALLLASWIKRAGDLDDELTVYGVGGTVRIRSWHGWRFEPSGGKVESHECYDAAKTLVERSLIGITAAMACFASAVRGETSDYPSPQQLISSQEIIHAFYQSLVE